MKVESVSAVLFFSAEPQRLADFYKARLGIPFEMDRHGAVGDHLEADLGDVHLAVLKGRPRDRSPGGISPTFRVKGLDAFIASLEAAGVAPVQRVRDLGEGRRVATFADPDGNSFNLIELGA